MSERSVLISGIGIAGPALAHWLLRFGFRPTLVERAPRLRTSGYVIDFWGAGFDITERMGLLPEVLRAGYQIREVRFVDEGGERVSGFDAEVFADATQGRFTSLLRGDLSAVLFRSIEGRAETLFGDSIVRMEEDDDGVNVELASGSTRRFDLVVGADGLHSAVRALTFGNERTFERFLHYTVAAFEIPGYRPRDEDVYLLFNVPGAQIGRFAMREDRTMVLVVIADEDPPSFDADDDEKKKRYLRDRFAGAGWECEQIFGALDDVTDLYFDRVSQIRMDRWTRGRVALVGDAAHCPSLLAGQGSALALIDAYVLAVELARHERHEDAFAAYESLLMPFMRQKQDAAARFASSFAPKSRFGLFVRNQIMKAFVIPGVAKLAFGSSLSDDINLPEEPREGARLTTAS